MNRPYGRTRKSHCGAVGDGLAPPVEKNRTWRDAGPFVCMRFQLFAVKPLPTTSLVSMTEMMAWGSWVRTMRRMVATSTVLAMI